MIDADAAKKLKMSGVTQADISIYSAVPEEHDKITGVSGSFDAAVSAIRYLKNYKIGVKMNSPLIHPLQDLKSLYALSKELNAKWLPDPFITQPLESRPNTASIKLMRSEMRSFVEFMLEKGLYKLEEFYVPSRQSGVCGFGNIAIHIDYLGNYHFCTSFGQPVASILDTTLDEIRKITAGLRKSVEENRPCKNCELLSYCQPCPALSLREDGSIYACSSMRKMFAEILKEIHLERIKLFL